MTTKLSEAESLREVLKTIADACDQEALAKADGYVFRCVGDAFRELSTLREKVARYEEALREIAEYHGENRILEDIAKDALNP